MTMKNIRHTGIVVTDMERSLRFYRDLLGLVPVIDFTEESEYIDTLCALDGVRLRMVKLVAEDGGMIELLQYLSHPRQRSEGNALCEIGPTHMAFTVDDVDKVFADWSAEGIRCNCPPQMSPDGKAKLFFCQDPDGTFLEIVEMMENV
ncbi:MAG: VOC family protein [Candidatus Latescibacteria bacterium]|nr:VOC family protein [Candidatus Latescibacterota bacterium]